MADKSIIKGSSMPSLSFQARLKVGVLLSLMIFAKKENLSTHPRLFVGTRNRADVQSQHAGAGNIMQGPAAGGFPPGYGPPPAQGGMHYK